MGGVSRYFSKISGSGVDVTLLKYEKIQQHCQKRPEFDHFHHSSAFGGIFAARLAWGIAIFLFTMIAISIPEE